MPTSCAMLGARCGRSDGTCDDVVWLSCEGPIRLVAEGIHQTTCCCGMDWVVKVERGEDNAGVRCVENQVCAATWWWQTYLGWADKLSGLWA